MKKCIQCGNEIGQSEEICIRCGTRQFEYGYQNINLRRKIEFINEELPVWLKFGLIDYEQSARIHESYRAAWNKLNDIDPAPANTPAAKQLEEYVPVYFRDQNPREPSTSSANVRTSPRTKPLGGLLEQANITYWHIVGGLLLITGLIGLVGYTWNTIGRYMVFALMILTTAGMYAITRSAFIQSYRIGGVVIAAIASLLLPLDFIAANSILKLPGMTLGFITTTLCLPIYLRFALRRTVRVFTAFVVIDLVAINWFGIAFLKSHFGVASPFLTLTYALLGALLSFFAVKIADNRRTIWLTAVHLLPLYIAFCLYLDINHPHIKVVILANLIAWCLLYGAIGILFDNLIYSRVATSLIIAATLWLPYLYGVDLLQGWWIYLLTAQAASIALDFYAKRITVNKTSSFNEALEFISLATGSIASLLTGLFVLYVALVYGFIAIDVLMKTLACTIVAAVDLRRRGYPLAGDTAAALVIVVVLMCAGQQTLIPAIHHNNMALILALTAVAAYRPIRNRTIMYVTGIAAIVCCIVLPLFYTPVTTIIFLLLSILSIADALMDNEILEHVRAIQMRAGLCFIVVAVAIQQHLWLPNIAKSIGVEINEAYAMIALIIVYLQLMHAMNRLERDDIRQAVRDVIIAMSVWAASLQIMYSMNPVLQISPLWICIIGIVLCGAVGTAISYLSECGNYLAVRYGISILALVILTYYCEFQLASQFGVTDSYIWLVAVASFLGALILGLLAPLSFQSEIGSNTMGNALGHLSILMAMAGLLHTLYAVFHPAVTVYTVILVIISSLLYWGSFYWRKMEAPASLWERAFADIAPYLSVISLILTASAFISRADLVEEIRVISIFAYAAIMYVVLAILEKNKNYLLAFSLCLNALYLYCLIKIMPDSFIVTVFRAGLFGLVWLGLGFFSRRAVSISQFRLDTSWMTAAWFNQAKFIAVATIITSIFAFQYFDNIWQCGILLISGAVMLGIGLGTRSSSWRHAGIWSFISAYCVYLNVKIFSPSLDTIDWYITPSGIYLLIIGLTMRRNNRHKEAQPYYFAGSLLVLTPELIAMWHAQQSIIREIFFTTECIAFILLGLGLRVKAFIAAGSAFLIGIVAYESRGLSTQIPWAIYATVIGLAIIVSALYMEKRRDEVLRWRDTLVTHWKEWD